MEELIIEKLDGETIRRVYRNYQDFKKEDLERMRDIATETITKINLMLTEISK